MMSIPLTSSDFGLQAACFSCTRGIRKRGRQILEKGPGCLADPCLAQQSEGNEEAVKKGLDTLRPVDLGKFSPLESVLEAALQVVKAPLASATAGDVCRRPHEASTNRTCLWQRQAE